MQMIVDIVHEGHEIEFRITEDRVGGSKTCHKYHANGYIGDIKKFTGVALADKKTNEYVGMERIKDIFSRDWIIRNAVEVCEKYEWGILTIRGLHYQLVARGMINSIQHYKRVVSGMIQARWDGVIAFEQFSDRDRAMVGETKYEETTPENKAGTAQLMVKHYLNNYVKNRWENQPFYVEVLIEKKALEGVFESPCEENDVALGACKGYPSLTFLKEASERFEEAEAEGKECIILYFGDYDPSGEDIPRSIQENMKKFGVNVKVDRRALMEEQVVEWNLPPAPVKIGDSRTASWDGLGQVELDAVEPSELYELCNDAIADYFDEALLTELSEIQEKEKVTYKAILKEFVKTL